MIFLENIQSCEFRQNRTVQFNRSPFTRKGQKVAFQDWGWSASVRYKPMHKHEARSLLAAIDAQAEGENYFQFGDPDFRIRQLNNAAGTVLVNGGGQSGYSLSVDGVTPFFQLFSAGDYFHVAHDNVTIGATILYKAKTDCFANSAGQATIQMIQPLKKSPIDNAAISVSNAVGLFTLTGYSRSSDSAGIFDITIEAEEYQF